MSESLNPKFVYLQGKQEIGDTLEKEVDQIKLTIEDNKLQLDYHSNSEHGDHGSAIVTEWDTSFYKKKQKYKGMFEIKLRSSSWQENEIDRGKFSKCWQIYEKWGEKFEKWWKDNEAVLDAIPEFETVRQPEKYKMFHYQDLRQANIYLVSYH